MTDQERPVAEIPFAELVEDRSQSLADIQTCATALRLGVKLHRDGYPVQDRQDGNRRIIATIDGEIRARLAVAQRMRELSADLITRIEAGQPIEQSGANFQELKSLLVQGTRW
jgi:hypothetical protein